MSKDGFRAFAKIDSVELGTGLHRRVRSHSATIYMSGAIQQCIDANFDLLSFQQKRGLTTQVHVIVSFGEEERSLYVPGDLVGHCIGDMSVKARGMPGLKSKGEVDVRADIRVAVDWEMLPYLLSIRAHDLEVAPVFYREGSATEKKTKFNELDSLTSHIERIYFSPVLPEANEQ